MDADPRIENTLVELVPAGHPSKSGLTLIRCQRVVLRRQISRDLNHCLRTENSSPSPGFKGHRIGATLRHFRRMRCDLHVIDPGPVTGSLPSPPRALAVFGTRRHGEL